MTLIKIFIKILTKILIKISPGVPNSSQEGGSQSGHTGDR